MSRVVMFVYNDVTRDSRVLKEAGSLAAAGHEVLVVGRWVGAGSGVPLRESLGGFEVIRVAGLEQSGSLLGLALVAPRSPILAASRFAQRLTDDLRRGPTGWVAACRLLLGGLLLAPVIALGLVLTLARGRGASPPRSGLVLALRWLAIVAGWARQAARVAGSADVYHAHDLTGLPAAISARRGERARLVYDSHELFLEAGVVAGGGLPRRLLRWLEGHWVRSADAVVTVNDSIAAELQRRYHPRRLIVLHNVPPVWHPPAERPDLLREAAGMPMDVFVALYHGGFLAGRGLEQIAEAIVEPGLERVHLAYLGYGPMRDRLDAIAADPRFGGRIHVLDSVPPAELLAWVASADVGLALTQRTSLNNWLSSPNKLFETIGTGTPVVTSDFPEMRRVVLGDPAGPLGAVCDPSDPRAIGRAIRSILELPEADRAALRDRCLAASRTRWNWEMEVRALLHLYADLTLRQA